MQTNSNQYIKFYRTKDLVIAAMLYSQGKKIDLIERGAVCYFVFENEPECERLAQMYWNNELCSNLKDFADSIKTVKNILFG